MKRIRTLDQLMLASLARRAVVVPSFVGFCDRKPAAFVLNLSGEILHRMMMNGMYLYEPREAKQKEGKRDHE